MRVKELITELGKCNPEAVVICVASNFELRGEKREARVWESRARKVSERFRDAFDNECYHTEIYRETSSAAEGEPVVVIGS